MTFEMVTKNDIRGASSGMEEEQLNTDITTVLS